MNCYNNNLKATIIWTHNVTNTSANNSMMNIWALSSDSLSVTINNEKNIPNNTVI